MLSSAAIHGHTIWHFKLHKSSVSDFPIPFSYSCSFRLLKPAVGWFSANLSCTCCWVMGMKMIMDMINIWDRRLTYTFTFFFQSTTTTSRTTSSDDHLFIDDSNYYSSTESEIVERSFTSSGKSQFISNFDNIKNIYFGHFEILVKICKGHLAKKKSNFWSRDT